MWVVSRFEIRRMRWLISAQNTALTPKALANFSPGFEQSENPGLTIKRAIKP